MLTFATGDTHIVYLMRVLPSDAENVVALVSGADARVRSLGHRKAIGEPKDTFLSAANHKVEDACIRSEPVQLTRTLKLVSHNSPVLGINIKRVPWPLSSARTVGGESLGS